MDIGELNTISDNLGDFQPSLRVCSEVAARQLWSS